MVPNTTPLTFTATEGVLSAIQPVATFTDPGGADVTNNVPNAGEYAALINWGDGTTTAGTITFSSGTFTVSGAHRYAEESDATQPNTNPYQITVTLSHGTSTPVSAVTALATVSDAAVQATGGLTLTVAAGASLPIQPVATFTDPGGAEAVGDYSSDIDWTGTGASYTLGAGSVSYNSSANTFTVTAGGPTFTQMGPHTILVRINHESAGSVTVSDTVAVSSAVASTVAFTTSPRSFTAATISSVITVQVEDQYGNPVAESNDVIDLSTTSSTGQFFAVSTTAPPITAVTTDSTGAASFVYYDTTAGTPTLTAVDGNANLTAHTATQQETVTEMAAPTPASPLGAIAASSGFDTPTFSWSSVSGAVQYYLSVKDAATGAAVINNANITADSFTPSTALIPGHSYTWYVGAEGSLGVNGPIVWSGATNFSLAALSAPTPAGPTEPSLPAPVTIRRRLAGAASRGPLTITST